VLQVPTSMHIGSVTAPDPIADPYRRAVP